MALGREGTASVGTVFTHTHTHTHLAPTDSMRHSSVVARGNQSILVPGTISRAREFCYSHVGRRFPGDPLITFIFLINSDVNVRFSLVIASDFSFKFYLVTHDLSKASRR